MDRWPGGPQKMNTVAKRIICPYWEHNPGRPARNQSLYTLSKSRDSSAVGIVLGYGLDDRGSRVRFPAGAEDYSLHYRVQNSSGAHPASYPMDTRVSFLEGKAAGA
jgi:hypothetical protein